MPANTISENTKRILFLLAEYKYLSARQIWDKSGAAMEGKSFEQTQVELNRMKKAGLIAVKNKQKEKGRVGEYQWLLLRPGARLIEFSGYGANYKRVPGPYQLQYRKLELALEEQVELAEGEWQLVKPLNYNSRKRLPARTEQFHCLCEALTWREYKLSGVKPADPYGPHTLIVPFKANHYTAFADSIKQAVILIIAKPRATSHFWQARKKEYGSLTTLLPVYGVFPDKQQLQQHQKLLTRLEMQATTIDLVSELLSRLALEK